MKNIYIIIFLLIIILFILFLFSNKYSNEYMTNESDNVTVVSGYWTVKNKHGQNYDNWFKNSLHINQRYIFFCDESSNKYISQFRGDYETIYINYPMNNFFTSKYAKESWINSTHVPSKELGMIWNEKVHLLKLAKDMDTVPTEYYCWIDAGVAPYREKYPPQERLNIKDGLLPPKKMYYSRVEDEYHNFAATVLLIHRDIIDEFHDKYYEILNTCQDEWKCGSDQYIFTKMMNKYPEMFHKISDGYGENLTILYEKYIVS
jgi:hypothetical protein